MGDESSSMMARCACLMLIIICSLCGVMYPLYLVSKNSDVRRTEWYATLKTASTGLVLGVAFLHLLDDADEALAQESDYPFAAFGLLVGVVLVTIVEQVVTARLSGTREVRGDAPAGRAVRRPCLIFPISQTCLIFPISQSTSQMSSKPSCKGAECASYQNGGAGDNAAGAPSTDAHTTKLPPPLTSPVFNATHHLAVLPMLKDSPDDVISARLQIYFLEVSISLHSIILGEHDSMRARRARREDNSIYHAC
jgi:hypothetical protein